jgi:hypothetical protein
VQRRGHRQADRQDGGVHADHGRHSLHGGGELEQELRQRERHHRRVREREGGGDRDQRASHKVFSS